MIVQPPSLDPAESSALPAPPPLGTAGSWLIGFHGAVSPSGLHAGDAGTPPSLRSIALAPRSLGLQPMSRLIDLPSLRRHLVAPNGANGARPVGATAAALTLVAPVAAPPPVIQARPVPKQDLWDATESLDSYLDRRLLQARVLYLPNRGRGYAVLKRLLDVVGALVLLLLTWPVMAVLAVLIRHDSPGPAIFAQQRVTRGGRLFTFYKFRTMWVDARERFPDLYDYRPTAGPGEVYYKLTDDPRNTNVGRWLRKTTLDELPNLFNVLRGDMSLVGPRPELPGLVSFYQPEDLALFFTKAGVTGLAQVAGRSLLTVRERISLDLRYVANQTLLLDIRILFATVTAVALRRGAF
jgi:lipopolysaccharide/colanic/teichoic acid biosynthesis glycosyltransferase